MFEKRLALRYLIAQKRHSIFTLCSIAVALALMTLLFVGYSTFEGVLRDSVYLDKPYHFKMFSLTEEELSQLAANPELKSCQRVEEADGSLSAEVMIAGYHDDIGLFINTLFPEKYLYSDLKEEYKTDLIDVNEELIYRDRLDFASKYEAVRNLAVYMIFILFLVLALRLMIDTAFEISSKQRERQFGMLQCMGASTGQIIRIIAFEGMFLTAIGLPVGMLLGVGLSAAAVRIVQVSGITDTFFTAEKAAQILRLHVHPLLLVLAAVTGLVWVFLSAYQTGMRIVKKSPIQAITGRSTRIERVQRFSLFGTLFGWKGRLAARNNKRQPKRFFITVLSLTLSIALFASFSIALKQSLAAFEKAVDLLGLNYDMSIGVKTSKDDPLSYRTGLAEIRESGYFTLEDFSRVQIAYLTEADGTEYTCLLTYYPRELFDRQMSGTIEVSYDDLTAQNGYILLIDPDKSPDEESLFDTPEQLGVVVQARTVVTEEDYQSMTAEEQANVKDYVFEDPVTGEKTVKYRYTVEFPEATIPAVGFVRECWEKGPSKQYAMYSGTGNTIVMLATLDTYENVAYQYAGNGSVINTEDMEYINVNLKDPASYEAAKAFVSEHSDTLMLYEDFYGDLTKLRTAVGALRIGIAFLSILIGVIALVNMINILSTGILNRKSEIAAMQSLGMTEGQLYGMTVIECLQYALTAGVLATVLLEGLLLMMLLFLTRVGLQEVFAETLSFTEPLPRIWIAAAVAFAAAVLASLIPLHRMQQESLTDRIRTVE